jgi:AcrR family transcriptional regulator
MPAGSGRRAPGAGEGVSASLKDMSVALTRLRSGRGPLSRDQVDGIQRARLVSAMVEVAAEHGFLGAAVGRVVSRAGVSRRTFYELFDSREDCFLAAFDWGVEQAAGQMAAAYAGESSWRDGIRAALAALLALLDSEPELARVCVVEALGAGTLVLERRARVLQAAADALSAGAPSGRGAAAGEPPLLTAETVVGGGFSVIHTRLLLREQDSGGARARKGGSQRPRPAHAPAPPLGQLLGQLMALILLPYLGPRAAGEELTRPAPALPAPRSPRARGTRRRILERLNVRLTYRTVRCLLFVAEHPGASNRAVAIGAEIADEGQASKLLTRLAGMDLLAKESSGPGHANAWRLTTYGQQVLQALQS